MKLGIRTKEDSKTFQIDVTTDDAKALFKILSPSARPSSASTPSSAMQHFCVEHLAHLKSKSTKQEPRQQEGGTESVDGPKKQEEEPAAANTNTAEAAVSIEVGDDVTTSAGGNAANKEKYDGRLGTVVKLAGTKAVVKLADGPNQGKEHQYATIKLTKVPKPGLVEPAGKRKGEALTEGDAKKSKTEGGKDLAAEMFGPVDEDPDV